jgi:hypothetical protein
MVPPKEMIAKFNRAHIVPMEAPPLGVPPGFESVIVGSGGSFQVIRGVAIFNTVALLAQIPEASKRGAEASQALQSLLDSKEPWSPTIALAKEIQAQLGVNGTVANLAPQIKVMPGLEDRSYTFFKANWFVPINGWYNDTEPVSDYRSIVSDDTHYVLEVGVSHYGIQPRGELLVQVLMKMISAADGRVIGRVRAADPWNVPKVTPYDQAFANDASRFKEIFSITAKELIRDCLTQLGLIR